MASKRRLFKIRFKVDGKANAENTASTENVEASEEEPEIVDAEFEDA